MAKVALVRQCKTPDGWRRFPVVMSGNGRVKPNTVLVDAKEQVFKEGYYQLRTYANGGRIIYRKIKGGPTEALAELDRERNLIVAREAVEGTGAQIVGDKAQKTL